MRWSRKRKPFTAIRARTRFWLWPKTVNGVTRWLEWGTVVETYHDYVDWMSGYGGCFWRAEYWVDDEPELCPCDVCRYCTETQQGCSLFTGKTDCQAYRSYQQQKRKP